jgi:hypothetical protein
MEWEREPKSLDGLVPPRALWFFEGPDYGLFLEEGLEPGLGYVRLSAGGRGPARHLEPEEIAEVVFIFFAHPFALGLAAFVVASPIVKNAIEAGVQVRAA